MPPIDQAGRPWDRDLAARGESRSPAALDVVRRGLSVEAIVGYVRLARRDRRHARIPAAQPEDRRQRQRRHPVRVAAHRRPDAAGVHPQHVGGARRPARARGHHPRDVFRRGGDAQEPAAGLHAGPALDGAAALLAHPARRTPSSRTPRCRTTARSRWASRPMSSSAPSRRARRAAARSSRRPTPRCPTPLATRSTTSRTSTRSTRSTCRSRTNATPAQGRARPATPRSSGARGQPGPRWRHPATGHRRGPRRDTARAWPSSRGWASGLRCSPTACSASSTPARWTPSGRSSRRSRPAAPSSTSGCT
jgi:hypothetical protein